MSDRVREACEACFDKFSDRSGNRRSTVRLWSSTGLPTIIRVALTMAVALVVVSGCAVTDYKPVVTSFSEATKKADDAFSAMRSAELTAQLNAHKKRILAGNEIVAFQKDDCIADSARCRLLARGATGKPSPLTATEGLENLSALMHAIGTYSDKLTAIIDAPTAKNAAASVAAAEGSILSAAEAANKIPGVKIDTSSMKAFGDPTANLASWVVGEYVNYAQVAALREAVKGANPVIKQIADLLSASSKLSFAPSQSLRETFQTSRAAFEDDPRNADKLDRYIQAASALDGYLSVVKSDLFAQMATAHDKLTQQLSGQNVTLAEVERSVQLFASQASSLWQIIQQYQKAAAAKQ